MREFTMKMPQAQSSKNPATQILQSKRTCACHKNQFMREYTGRRRIPEVRPTFCASLRIRNGHRHVRRTFLGSKSLRKMLRPRTGTTVFRKPAQSKCTWTCHKSQFKREFTGKMPRPKTGTTVLCEPGPVQSTCT